MTSYDRQIEIHRESLNPETGEFVATIFTGGEATDGHILNIPGGEIPKQMPFFVNHQADPRTQLGSLYRMPKGRNEIQMRGQLMLEGEGAEAEIRRDIFAKMMAGHVTRFSGRWDAEDKDVTRRINLPKDHQAYVSEKDDSRKRWGLYFDKWRAMEGSIVGLNSDQDALLRWAEDDEVTPAVREFWRGMAEDIGRREASDVEMLASLTDSSGRPLYTEAELRARDSESDLVTFEFNDLQTFLPREMAEALKSQIDTFSAANDELADENALLEADLEKLRSDLEAAEARATEAEAALEARREESGESAAPSQPERVEDGEPLPPQIVRPRELFTLLNHELEKAGERVRATFRAEIDKARGRVSHE